MLMTSVWILFLLVLEVRVFIKRPKFQALVILILIKYGFVGFLITVVYFSQESFIFIGETEPPFGKINM